MSSPPRQHANTPRLTLAQVGRVLGINAQARLPAEIENVMFVAIDCEAYEFAQHKTTEIGVSILDTVMIANTAPGFEAAAWLAKVKSEHFRIKEFAHLVNKRWVKGDPDSFSFGTSTWIGRSEASNVLAEIFNPSEPGDRRNIVLVGHGLKNEVAYLKNLHFDLMNAPNVVATVDTQSIGPTKSQIGLKKLCQAVSMEPQSLHNAGNDAAYTLRAMILATILYDSDPALFRAAFLPAISVRPAISVIDGVARAPDRQQHQNQMRSKPQQKVSSASKNGERVLDPPHGSTKSKSRSHEERKAAWRQKQPGATAKPAEAVADPRKR